MQVPHQADRVIAFSFARDMVSISSHLISSHRACLSQRDSARDGQFTGRRLLSGVLTL